MGDATVKTGGDEAGPAPEVLEPALPAGALVAGRYRVVRFLARGGMGEVYEAEDQALGERIALKTLRTLGGSQGSSESRALDRFKREVQLARKVTHPNVCRIFDLGVDEAGGARTVFLTMELLDGESLAERVARGPLDAAEALPLVTQMADALDRRLRRAPDRVLGGDDGAADAAVAARPVEVPPPRAQGGGRVGGGLHAERDAARSIGIAGLAASGVLFYFDHRARKRRAPAVTLLPLSGGFFVTAGGRF